MIRYKYRVKFKTDLFEGASEGECEAVDSDAAIKFLTEDTCKEMSILENEIINISIVAA